MTDVPARLSCEQCKRRKTKCDKTSPQCSACKLANISCHPVQRSRLPRGRTGNVKHKNVALADKIVRLESLVGRLEAQVREREDASTSNDSGKPECGPDPGRSTSRLEDLVARDFWTALSREVVGLRETLEGNDGEDNQQPDPVQRQLQPGAQSTSNLLLFGRGSETISGSNTHVIQSMRSALIQIYHERVDILFKLTHWPTVMNTLQNNDDNHGTPTSGLASIALEWCICFTAANTLSEQDCEELHLGSKPLLIDHCRSAAETSLSQTNFLIEPSFHSLQAFTIYLMGLRTSGQGALSWAFISLAIRLANALDIGSETNNKLSALEIEQRRRLWFGIGLLDSQAAFGRGSIPILAHTDFSHPPLNIDDAEVGVRTISARLSTEMSFSCLTHEALLCQRRLCDPSIRDPQERADIVTRFQSAMTLKYAHLEFSENPLQRYTALAAKDMSLNIQLILRRPPYRSTPSNSSTSQTDVSDLASSTLNILDTATEILERGLVKHHSTEFAQWSWFAWPRWYALAILLVELSSTPTSTYRPTEPYSKVDRAYNVALQSFNNYAQSATEVSTGTIWTPIVKLMRHVQKLRGDTTPLNLDNHPHAMPTTMNAQTTQPSERTILARYCDALSDFNSDPTTTHPPPETNPDLLWGAFLDDLNETGMWNGPAIAIPGTAPSQREGESGQRPDSTTESTWSLTPYPPMFPHLLSRNGEQSETQTQQAQAQAQAQAQTSINDNVRLTLMENGQEGRSVVGRVFDFM